MARLILNIKDGIDMKCNNKITKKKTNNKITEKKTNTSVIIAIMGIIVSIIALGVSYKGYKLSAEQYDNSKIAIYRADVANDSETLILKPYSDKIYLQLADVYFPTKISGDKQPFKVNNGDYKLYLNLVLFNLQEILKEKITINKGYVGVCQLSVPLIISSNYIYNGTVYGGRGLYGMLIDATINEFGKVTIKFKNIVYIRGVTSNSDPYEVLDSEWEENFNNFKSQN